MKSIFFGTFKQTLQKTWLLVLVQVLLLFVFALAPSLGIVFYATSLGILQKIAR